MRMPSIKYEKLVKTSARNKGRRRCMKSTMAGGKLSMGCPPCPCVTNKDGQLQRGEQTSLAAYFTHKNRELQVFELAVVRRLLHADLGDILPLRGEPHDHGGVYHGIVLRGR